MKQVVQIDQVKQETERIRTYRGVRNTVKDHRINDEVFSYDDVLNGNGLENTINVLKDINQ